MALWRRIGLSYHPFKALSDTRLPTENRPERPCPQKSRFRLDMRRALLAAAFRRFSGFFRRSTQRVVLLFFPRLFRRNRRRSEISSVETGSLETVPSAS
jgi:hypothetical protein